MKYVRQEGLRDCGICCLYNIIRYYNGYVDIEKLRILTNTNENGTSIFNLVTTSNKLGFISKAYHCDINDLQSLEFPLIAYIKLNNYYHFVIIDDIDVDKISVFDPIRGKVIYNIDDFLKDWQKIVITFEKRGEIVKDESYYFNYLKTIINENKRKIIIVSIASIFCIIFELLLSGFIKKVFDNNIIKGSFLYFFLFLFVKWLIDFIRSIFSIRLNNNIDYNMSLNVYKKIYSLPIKYHHNRPIGDITTKINDMNCIKDLISTFTMSTVIDLLLVGTILLIVLFKKISLFFIILFTFLLYVFIYYIFREEERNMLDKVKNENSNKNSLFIENLNGIETIKNLNIEKNIINKHTNTLLSYIKSINKFHFFILIEDSFLSFIESLGLLLILYKGYVLIKGKLFTTGDLIFIYSLFLTAISSIKNIINFDRSFISSDLSYKRINNLLNTNTSNKREKCIEKINKIIFSNVSINNKLNDFNFEINRGDYVLVNGISGIGKSTLFKSLIKETDILSGEISINGININNLKDSSIRNNICYVGQDEYIFNDTIKNNILMFKSNKNLDKALKVSLVDKMLKKKSISLDYLLEENGHNLSGGERQKLLIARALMRDTDYIIFDETMNELDIDSERKILKNIYTEYKKTIILISHRNSNIEFFNKKVIIE